MVLTYPKICPCIPLLKMASMGNWFRCPCTSRTNINRLKQTLAIPTHQFPLRRLILELTYIRTQHWLDWWMPRPRMWKERNDQHDDFEKYLNESITCHPCSKRLLSTALNHMTASLAWKSFNFLQRSCKNIPKHFNNSEVDACKLKSNKRKIILIFIARKVERLLY